MTRTHSKKAHTSITLFAWRRLTALVWMLLGADVSMDLSPELLSTAFWTALGSFQQQHGKRVAHQHFQQNVKEKLRIQLCDRVELQRVTRFLRRITGSSTDLSH